MIDDSCKIEILNKITSSKAFVNSDKYVELLKFLVQCEITGNTVKEYTLAVEILKKDKEFNPADNSQVRIYMHRLRNKIESYYENEGKNDKIMLIIPKGHYEVRFQPQGFMKRSFFSKIYNLNIILIFLILMLIIFNIVTIKYYQSKHNFQQQINEPIPINDPIWANFFNNKLSTTIVIGDDFQFWRFDPKLEMSRQIVDYAITSISSFERFEKQNPDQLLKRERHGALPLNCAWNIYDLAHVLYSFNQKANLELSSLFMASQFDLTNLVDRNIIYIGGFRNLREFNNILAKLPIKYEYTDIFKGTIAVKNSETDSLLTFTGKKLNDQYHRDLGLIAKLGGSNNENYLFLIGFAFPAQIETVRLLSRRDLLAKIYSQIHLDPPGFPEHFFLIIEILASEFSAIETNVKYFQAVTSKVR